MQCLACNNSIRADKLLKCVPCGGAYHFECLNMAVEYYKGHISDLRRSWLCPTCSGAKRRPRGDDTPTRSQHDLNILAEQFDMSCDDLSGDVPSKEVAAAPVIGDFRAPSPKAQFPSVVDITQDFRREFLQGMEEMRAFRREMAELSASLATAVSRLDGVERRLESVERHQAEVDTKHGAEKAELERCIAELKQELNDRDQEALLADLDIGHLPEEKGENVIHVVTVLASRLGVTLEPKDVVFAERVGVPPGETSSAGKTKPRRVVVRLARRHLRDELLQAARVRRNVTTEGGSLIFINERLTRPNRQLFYRVRQECDRLRWTFSWTKRGRIYAREGAGKQAFHIRSQADMERIFKPPSPGTQT